MARRLDTHMLDLSVEPVVRSFLRLLGVSVAAIRRSRTLASSARRLGRFLLFKNARAAEDVGNGVVALVASVFVDAL